MPPPSSSSPWPPDDPHSLSQGGLEPHHVWNRMGREVFRLGATRCLGKSAPALVVVVELVVAKTGCRTSHMLAPKTTLSLNYCPPISGITQLPSDNWAHDAGSFVWTDDGYSKSSPKQKRSARARPAVLPCLFRHQQTSERALLSLRVCLVSELSFFNRNQRPFEQFHPGKQTLTLAGSPPVCHGSSTAQRTPCGP